MTLESFIDLIEDPDTREKVKSFHEKHREVIDVMPASVRHHHKGMGGYYIHLTEMANNALSLYYAIPSYKSINRDDLILAVYFHDIDKLFHRYQLCKDPASDKQIKYAESLGIPISRHDNKVSVSAKIDYRLTHPGEHLPEEEAPYFEYQDRKNGFAEGAIQLLICAREGIILNDEVAHAICFAHGGWTPGISKGEELSPLATLLHCTDMLSCKLQNGKLDHDQYVNWDKSLEALLNAQSSEE